MCLAACASIARTNKPTCSAGNKSTPWLASAALAVTPLLVTPVQQLAGTIQTQDAADAGLRETS
jgi:hypothetical protein